MNKKVVFIIVLFLVILLIGFTVYIMSRSIDMKEANKIIKYELKTSEYFSHKSDVSKYFIDSVDELKKFYEIYSDQVDVNEDYLNDKTVFIQVQEVASGSIEMKLKSVNFKDNKVNFVISEDSSSIGTGDMAFWYFVAVIPNEKIKGLDLSDWSRPSKVLSS